ncbi:MAG: hypothetical protein FWG88_11095 [Oscillospiraceae bacterium]|nr:hypothetical protein [Oscillospiraceae bacterium]
MGTTLANIHIFDGDEQIIRNLLPNAIIGKWSTRFISVYTEDFIPNIDDKTIKSLSMELSQPILLAWIFDSDAVGFAIYQNGKKAADHIMNPSGFSKIGNTATFCKSFDLSSNDRTKLRAIWEKGDAEEQFELTALMFGLPFYNNHENSPTEMHTRDIEAIDNWIAERHQPQKVRNETKMILIQELTNFRWKHGANNGSLPYCGVEPYDDEYAIDEYQFWASNADGTLYTEWTSKEILNFDTMQGRTLSSIHKSGVVIYDSVGLLVNGDERKGQAIFLHDGGILWIDIPTNGDNDTVTFICCAYNGSELWRKTGTHSLLKYFAHGDGEILFIHESQNTPMVERVNASTGETIDIIPKPFGLNVSNWAYINGFWWVSHDGIIIRDGKRVASQASQYLLTQYNNEMIQTNEVSLPIFTQELYFSPDNSYIYVFFYKKQVIVYNAKTLAIESTLDDKSQLILHCFDSSGRFWLQRDNSTVEAWDELLSKTLSRHRVKGVIYGRHIDEYGAICFVTWSEREKVLRVYKLI